MPYENVGDSSPEISRANTLPVAAGEHVDRLVVIERGHRLVQPDRDVVRLHHLCQAIDDRGELGEALRA